MKLIYQWQLNGLRRSHFLHALKREWLRIKWIIYSPIWLWQTDWQIKLFKKCFQRNYLCQVVTGSGLTSFDLIWFDLPSLFKFCFVKSNSIYFFFPLGPFFFHFLRKLCLASRKNFPFPFSLFSLTARVLGLCCKAS